MLDYWEAVELIADNAFEDLLAGGQGRLDSGLVNKIYNIDEDEVLVDAKRILDAKFDTYNKRWDKND